MQSTPSLPLSKRRKRLSPPAPGYITFVRDGDLRLSPFPPPFLRLRGIVAFLPVRAPLPPYTIPSSTTPPRFFLSTIRLAYLTRAPPLEGPSPFGTRIRHTPSFILRLTFQPRPISYFDDKPLCLPPLFSVCSVVCFTHFAFLRA